MALVLLWTATGGFTPAALHGLTESAMLRTSGRRGRAAAVQAPRRISSPPSMQLPKWPGAESGQDEFYPEASNKQSADFALEKGSLRRQILDNSNFVQGTLGGYSVVRNAMRSAFARVSKNGDDNGWIETADEFKQLMRSVGAHALLDRVSRCPTSCLLCQCQPLVCPRPGEELPEEDYERLYDLCLKRPDAFNGQRPGSVVFEQWVNVMLETAEEARDPDAKRFFGLF